MSIFLTESDIEELTGCKTRKCQCAWLESRCWIFEVSRLGRVKVLRRYAEMRLGLPIESTAKPQKESQPNFDMLRTSI